MSTLTTLTEKAVNAFLSGRIIGGIGAVGAISLGVAIVIIETGLTVPFYNDPEFYLCMLFILSGLLLVGLSGSLYAKKGKMEHEIYMSIVNGYNDASRLFIQKVNEGTVNAKDVNKLVESNHTTLLGLLNKEQSA